MPARDREDERGKLHIREWTIEEIGDDVAVDMVGWLVGDVVESAERATSGLADDERAREARRGRGADQINRSPINIQTAYQIDDIMAMLPRCKFWDNAAVWLMRRQLRER